MFAEKVIKKWLTEAYDYERPRRGEIREGVLMELNWRGAVVDVGLKHDGLVPHEDIEHLEEETISKLKPGQEVRTQIVQPEDREGRLLLSLFQVQAERDWAEAEEKLASGEVWSGQVTGYNRGGLLVKINHIEGFVPASHLWTRSKSMADYRDKLGAYVGEELSLKVIEVNRETHRLILSERLAKQELRQKTVETLLNELVVGQVRRAVVRHLTDFGAFVDLGGFDGLIHISELAWWRVHHPREVVQVGDEVEVYVLKIDEQRQRVNLSLKRLQSNPWNWADVAYKEGQLVTGRVTHVAKFGAFVLLEHGLEGLVHLSELADPPPSDPREFVERGDELVLRIVNIDIPRQRLALSLKRVSEAEGEEGNRADETPDEAPEP